MASSLYQGQGFGTFYGTYTFWGGAGLDGDLVVVTIQGPGSTSIAQVRAISVMVVPLGVVATVGASNPYGWFADWALIQGDATPYYKCGSNGVANVTPSSGLFPFPNFITPFVGYGPSGSAPSTIRRVVSGGSIVFPATFAVNYTTSGSPFVAAGEQPAQQRTWEADYAPQSDPGFPFQLILCAPQPLLSSGTPSNYSFSFRIDVQGLFIPKAAGTIAGYQMTRPLPTGAA